jgi:predicted RNA-binding Zn ribbon-like protein
MARFTFHRGSLALNFAGTIGRRASHPEERLPDRAALAAWLREARLIPAGTPVTDANVTAARELREAVARVGAAVVDSAPPLPGDVDRINAAAGGLPPLRLDPQTARGVRAGIDPVDAALARVAEDAIAVFAERHADLVRCGLPECGALLLSNSNGPRRRWCTMDACGNVAKARAHRARRASPGSRTAREAR